MKYDKTQFDTKDELFKFLKENKNKIIAGKKAEMKKAEGVMVIPQTTTVKAINTDSDSLTVKAVINTTNWMDSHDDVHLPGIWNKSLKENKNIIHLQEHELKFDKIIADGNELKASVWKTTFKELGYNYDGDTEALTFDSTVKKERNTFMFDQYNKGRVKNHSVGMQYVKIALAVNSEDKFYAEEKEIWDKYINEIANKAHAEDQGYFWAVTEAKVVEGSAVPIGSNIITPTIEPEKSTQTEPSLDTQKAKEIIHESFKSLIN